MEERENDVECWELKKWVLSFFAIVNGLISWIRYNLNFKIVLYSIQDLLVHPPPSSSKASGQMRHIVVMNLQVRDIFSLNKLIL